MSQSPQDPENGREGPEQAFGQQGEQPTQAFGQQGEQPTQAYPQGPPPGAPGAGGGQPWQAGAGQQGGYDQQGGYGQQDPRAQGGYPSYGTQPHRSEYGQSGGYGDPDDPNRRRSSKTPIIAVIVVAALVVAGLIFGGIALFGAGDDPEPVVVEDTDDPADEPPAGGDEGTVDEDGTETDEGTNAVEDPDGEPGGLLYDLLTSQVEVVDGDLTQWTIDDPGWENYEVEDADPIEAYVADFTSDADDSLQMWAVRMDDAEAAVDYGEALVEERGSSDESGPVWEIEDEEEIEDDLAYGQFHLWEDGDDIEVLWWDDTGIVRHVSGPAEETWDFYLYAGV